MYCEKGFYIGRDVFGREKLMKISDVVNVGFILVDIVSYDVFLVVELIREIK